MSALGIYFGPKVISVAETKSARLVNSLQIPQERILSPDLEEKVPGEIKLVSLFNEEFAKNKIQAKEVTIVVSGKDLIIRTFDIPFISANELTSAVNFEVKKYIPFKVEDLVSDFQVRQDKSTRRNLVLFVGIKKESLDKYLTVANQLNIKIHSIEYSAFSVLRLLKSAGVNTKGIVALVNIDLKEEDEVNFIVLNNGFPLFSRDIILSTDSVLDAFQPETMDSTMMLDKLRTELRISLDFYQRKFPLQKIQKAFFIIGEENRAELEAFMKERGLVAQFLDFKKSLGKNTPYSLSLLKAYSGSLVRTIGTPLRIDLLQVKTRADARETTDLRQLLDFRKFAVPIKPGLIIASIIICILPFAFGFYRTTTLKKELNNVISMKIKVPGIQDSQEFVEIKKVTEQYEKKIEEVNVFLKSQTYLTEMLDNLTRSVPEGVVLTTFDFKVDKSGFQEKIGKSYTKDKAKDRKSKLEVSLQGYVLREEKERAIELVNNFNYILKGNPAFNKRFNDIGIQSIQQRTGNEKDSEAADFNIVCRVR